MQAPVQATTAAAWYTNLPRLGQISFINSLPVILPIEKQHLQLPCEIVLGSPAELNALYARGALDLGAMSSFFYLEHGGFELVPEIAISCNGPVGSVLFFSKVSPHRLKGARVAVPASSATSVNLLKVLLIDQLNVCPELVVESEPDLDSPDVEGALVIGDRALAVDADWSNRFWRADLGQWWVSRTGLPMVFGVWAGRSEWVREHPDQFKIIGTILNQSAELGLSALLPLVVSEARSRTGLEPIVLNRYFRNQLSFRMTQRHRDGLEHFRELCQQYGLFTHAGDGVLAGSATGKKATG